MVPTCPNLNTNQWTVSRGEVLSHRQSWENLLSFFNGRKLWEGRQYTPLVKSGKMFCTYF